MQLCNVPTNNIRKEQLSWTADFIRMLQYVLEMQGSKRVTLGSDYPFPLGDLEIGKFITEMGLSEDVVEDIFCNSTLEWLDLKKEDYL